MSLPIELSFFCPAGTQIEGPGVVGYCGRCDRAVHDLSAMTREEAERFLALCGHQKICVRYRAQAGQVRHRPPSRLGRLSLALGLGIGGLALAEWVQDEEVPAPVGSGSLPSLPTEGLRSTVSQALEEAERGWQVRQTEEERRAAVLQDLREAERDWQTPTQQARQWPADAVDPLRQRRVFEENLVRGGLMGYYKSPGLPRGSSMAIGAPLSSP